MKCPYCGAELIDNTNFCSYCGGKIEKEDVASSPSNSDEKATGNENTFSSKLRKFYDKNTKLIVAIILILLIAKFSHSLIPTIIKFGTIILAVLLLIGKIKCSKKWLQILCHIVAAIFALSLFPSKLWSDNERANNPLLESFSKAAAPYSAQNCIGQDKDDIEYDFIASGFYSVITEPIEDLEIDEADKNGTVISVSIDGSTNFAEDTEFKSSSIVRIKYHSYKHIPITLSSDEAKNMDVEFILEALESAGFTNISTEEVYDLDPNTTHIAFENKIYINGTNSFIKGTKFPLDADIKIYTHLPYEEYTLKVVIDFVPNLFFNTYDVEFSVDEHTETLSHGNDCNFEYPLKKDKYTLTFKSTESNSITKTVDVNLTGDTEVSYRISCHTDRIDIDTLYVENKNAIGENEAMVPSSALNCKYKNYKDIETLFSDAGFTNIDTEILYDIYWGWTEEGEVERVSINGKTDFNRGEIFSKDAKVVITYHMSEEDDPNRIIEPTPTPFVEKEETVVQETVSSQVQETESATTTTPEILLPQEGSKLDKDFYFDSDKSIYYVNSDNLSNKPRKTTWGNATVTDGVAEYLNYLVESGFTVTITNSSTREPYSGFYVYETYFSVTNSDISWTLYSCIQDEDFVEYEFYIEWE